MKKIKIGNRFIAEDKPCFIIAEAGVNHDCILKKGFELIKKAKQSGADAIKFQTYKAERLTTRDAKKYWCKDKETQYENYKKLDKFEEKDYKKLKDYASKQKIIFFSTPFDKESVDLLEKIGVCAYKIASADITNFPLIEYIAKKNKPIFLATGASNLNEIKEAVNLIKLNKNNKIILMHCILSYPTPDKDANVNFIKTLKKKFPDLLIGISDHTTNLLTPLVAVALGARVVEKHYTLDKNIRGSSDHPISIDPSELKEISCNIRDVEVLLGKENFSRPSKVEKPAHKLARRSIVAKGNIKKGEIIKKEMLDFKRPGYGISPKDLNKVIGKKARKEIKEDKLIMLGDLK